MKVGEIAPAAARDQDFFADAIRVFEPRLTAVAVSLVDEPDSLERMLRFRIEATLLLEAETEVVTFDSRVETATRVVLVNP